MKREFGKAWIEEYLPTVNLELIVNTSGAYIPGHGTPTVLLFGTHEPPVAREVGAVLAKRGEPSTARSARARRCGRPARASIGDGGGRRPVADVGRWRRVTRGYRG